MQAPSFHDGADLALILVEQHGDRPMPWDVQKIVQAGGLKIDLRPATLKDR